MDVCSQTHAKANDGLNRVRRSLCRDRLPSRVHWPAEGHRPHRPRHTARTGDPTTAGSPDPVDVEFLRWSNPAGVIRHRRAFPMPRPRRF